MIDKHQNKTITLFFKRKLILSKSENMLQYLKIFEYAQKLREEVQGGESVEIHVEPVGVKDMNVMLEVALYK